MNDSVRKCENNKRVSFGSTHSLIFNINQRANDMKMLIKLSVLACVAWTQAASALNTTTSYTDTGKLAHSTPVTTHIYSTALPSGGRFISQQADVLPKQVTATGSSKLFTFASKQWTYTRGVGEAPSVCETGYEQSGLLCKKVGASWFSKQKPMQCRAGLVNSNGLCYKPCAEKFKGFGPFCSGNLMDLDTSNVPKDVAAQHAKALERFNQPGIRLKNGEPPRIKTDLAFGPTTCGLSSAITLGTSALNKVSNALIGQLGKAIVGNADLDIKNSSGDTIWSAPSINDFVAYDISAKPTCTQKADKYVATLNIDNSITTKVSTEIFDPLFHNLGGVDAGIAKVSIYELIPFRIYGSSGVTLGTELNLASTVLKDKPPYMINGIPHAHQTALKVTPSINVWLGLDAYVRVTSILDAIPDLFQVGGDIDLDVIDWQLPYALAEGVTYDSGARQLFMDETLNSAFSSGSGQAKPFLKVLGREINTFKDSDTKRWTGYQESQNLLTRKGVY